MKPYKYGTISNKCKMILDRYEDLWPFYVSHDCHLSEDEVRKMISLGVVS